MQEFKLLTYDEEKQLSYNEKINYYKNLKINLHNKKICLFKNIYLNTCENLNRNAIRDILNKVKGYELEIINPEPIPDIPVIYASSHQELFDHFNVVLAIPDNAVILNNVNISPIVKSFLNLNGIVYVNRDDKESRFKSKIELMECISKGKSIVVFPEGTYNCSPNKLVLPFHSGIIDISRKMQVPIVPIVQEYIYDKDKIKKCIIKFGAPVYVGYDDNNEEKREELKEEFSTIRYNLIEQKGLYSRESVSEEEYINQIRSKEELFKKIHTSFQMENQTIYDSKNEFYQYFPINQVEEKRLLKKCSI